MHTRRIAVTLGAAGGGVLAAAFLSSGLANADTSDVTPVPPTLGAGDSLSIFNPDTSSLGGVSLENPIINTVNGIPPFFQDATGTQYFTVDDLTAQGTSTTAAPVGTVNDYYSQWTLGPVTNTEYTISEFGPTPGVTEPTFTTLPGDGSVFDTLNLGNGLENVYTDVLAGSGSSLTSTVTDSLDFDGTQILNLTPFVDALALNPADFTLF